MDDAVNMQLMTQGIGINYPRFLAENGIQFYRPLAFPSKIRVGLRIVHLGRSSVTYDIGFFDHHPHDNDSGDEEKDGMINEKEEDEDKCTSISLLSDSLAARGKYVHVYVDKATGRPTPIPDKARRVLELLLVDQDHKV